MSVIAKVNGNTFDPATGDCVVPQWLSGVGAPAGGLGNVGDLYVDEGNANWYKKTGATTWIVKGNFQGGITAINEQIGTAYGLILTDATKAVRCTNASAIAVTVPTNASIALPLLCTIPIMQGGAGVVTLVAASGVTFESPNGVSTVGTGDFRTLFQRAANIWVVG